MYNLEIQQLVEIRREGLSQAKKNEENEWRSFCFLENSFVFSSLMMLISGRCTGWFDSETVDIQIIAEFLTNFDVVSKKII